MGGMVSIQCGLRHCGIALLGLVAFGASGSAAAKPVTYQFDGRLTSTPTFSDNASWKFESGQSFRGTLVYDIDAITYSHEYISSPDSRYTQYVSPIKSMSFEISLGNDAYKMNFPVERNFISVFSDTSSYPRYGAGMYMLNYNWDGTPLVPIPDSVKVGNWNPHSAFIDFATQDPTVSGSYPNVDLIKLFDAAQGEYDRMFSVRFSDPKNWTVGAEHLDGWISGRIENFSIQSAVPEPQLWTMLIVGFGAVGAGLRKRASANAVQARA